MGHMRSHHTGYIQWSPAQRLVFWLDMVSCALWEQEDFPAYRKKSAHCSWKANTENGTPPPCRRKIRCQGEVDTRFPSLEGTAPCLGTPIDQCEAELGVEGDRLGHCPDGKGYGTNVVNHAGGLAYRCPG